MAMLEALSSSLLLHLHLLISMQQLVCETLVSPKKMEALGHETVHCCYHSHLQDLEFIHLELNIAMKCERYPKITYRERCEPMIQMKEKSFAIELESHSYCQGAITGSAHDVSLGKSLFFYSLCYMKTIYRTDLKHGCHKQCSFVCQTVI